MEEDSFQVFIDPKTNAYRKDVSILKHRISNLEYETGAIFSKIHHFKQKCVDKNFMLINMSKKTESSTAKLYLYQSEVKSIFQKTNDHQELQNMRDAIAQKTQTLGNLRNICELSACSNTSDASHNSGISGTEIQSNILVETQHLHKIKIELIDSIKKLEFQVNSLKEEELQIEKTIKIIRKRNAAQLLRLKHLINEARLREQHWSAEVQSVMQRMRHTDS